MTLKIAVLATVLAGMSVPVLASNLIDATDPERVLNVARGFGSADLGTSPSTSNPRISGRIEGTRYYIFFYGCTNNRNCSDIQFRATWSAPGKYSLADMNTWNRSKRYGKAYLDSDNDPVLEMPVNIKHGVAQRNLEDSFNWWKVALRGFKKDVLKID